MKLNGILKVGFRGGRGGIFSIEYGLDVTWIGADRIGFV